MLTEFPKKVKECFSAKKGFVTLIDFNFKYANSKHIDILFLSKYGERNVAPVVTNLLSEIPTDDELKLLADIFAGIYAEKWLRMNRLCDIEYNPIYNYKDELIEKSTNDVVTNSEKSSNNTLTGKIDGTRTNTRTDNLSSSTVTDSTDATSNSTNDSVFGFNSQASVGTDSEISNSTETLKSTVNSSNTGTQDNSGKDVTVTENVNKAVVTSSDKNAEVFARNFTHTGNIGNLTTQQLIKQEMDLWEWKFTQMVLNDLKEFLTLPIYMG